MAKKKRQQPFFLLSSLHFAISHFEYKNKKKHKNMKKPICSSWCFGNCDNKKREILRTNLIIDPANSLSLKRHLSWLISISILFVHSPLLYHYFHFVFRRKSSERRHNQIYEKKVRSNKQNDIKKLRNWKILPFQFSVRRSIFSRVKFNYL